MAALQSSKRTRAVPTSVVCTGAPESNSPPVPEEIAPDAGTGAIAIGGTAMVTDDGVKPLDELTAFCRLAHSIDGFGFVIFDGNHAAFRAQYPGHDLDAALNFIGPLPHRHVVSGNIGLAFGAVNDQRVHLAITGGPEFDTGGKASAPHATDPGVTDKVQHGAAVELAIVGHWA